LIFINSLKDIFLKPLFAFLLLDLSSMSHFYFLYFLSLLPLYVHFLFYTYRVIVLGEGAHELVLDAMAYFERKSEAKGLLLNRMGMAFLQNLTAGDGGHKPRQLLLSPGHLNFLDRFEDIMFTFAGDQVGI